MNSILKLRELKNSLTKSEKKLADFILENLDTIKSTNTYELAEKIGVSQATIVRFSKKLGYSGYPAFKVELSEDIGRASQKEERNIIHNEIETSDSYKDIASKIMNENLSAITETFSIMDDKVVEEAVESLHKASKILIAGVGFSSIVGRDFYYKLLESGRTVMFIQDTHIQMSNLSVMNENDILFAISHSGETSDVFNIVRKAKAKNIKVISLTKVDENPISDLADIKLFTISEEVKYRSTAISSRIAQLSVIDVLHIGLIRRNYKTIKKYLENSREMVKDLKL